MVERLIRWAVYHPIVIGITCLLLVIGMGYGAKSLEFTTDYRVFFSKENPQLQAFETLQDTYTKNDNLMFILAPRDGNVFTRETLKAVREITDASWKLPFSLRVDSLSNFQYTYAEEDDLIVEDLVLDPESLSAADLQHIRAVAMQEPILKNRLVSARGHVTGVNVTVNLPGKSPNEVFEIVAAARALVKEMRRKAPHIKIRLSGVVMLNNAFPESMQRDVKTLIPIMFLVVVVSLALLLRSISGTIVSVVIIMMSVVAALGMAGWLGIRLTAPVMSAPTMIMTLAVADCVHILVNLLHLMREGMAKKEALIESLRLNLQPIFLTSATTAIGFMSMNFSDAPPFRDLGNVVAFGVIMAFFFSIVLLPALVMMLPLRVRPSNHWGSRAMDRFAEFVIARRSLLLWGMGIVVILLIAQVPRNELNDEFVKYFDKTVDFRQDTDFMVENLTGVYSIEYSLQAEEAGGINEPAYLAKLEEFADWYRQQPEVLHVTTFSDIMKRLNKNMHGDDPAYYRLPEQRNLAAQYLLLYEFSLPFGLDLNNQINVKKSATRFVVLLLSLSSKQLLALDLRTQDWMKENMPASMQAHGASPSIMFSYIGERNIRSMLTGTTVALVLISLLLGFALRSWKIGILSLIPNLIPAGMAFGLWALFVGQVGLALSVVTGMTLGIVVDDTVHFLSKFLRARREQGLSAEDAVRYAFASVGKALWITSVVLIAGFSVLSFSAFELNSKMGLLTAITIALALLADFLLLPPLLMKLEEKTGEKTTVDTAAKPTES